MLKYLNSFILIGIILLLLSIADLVFGKAVLTEPGQVANPNAWLIYLGAAILMLVNGAVTVMGARKHEEQKNAEAAREATVATENENEKRKRREKS